MMELTRKAEYAIRGIIFLAQQQGKVSLISEIASATGVPQTFLAKIFQSFAKLDLINSSRGTRGGFVLARPASSITLLQIVEAVEGPIMPNRCLGDSGTCDREEHCKVHDVWRKVQSDVVGILENVTIETLAASHKSKEEI